MNLKHVTIAILAFVVVIISIWNELNKAHEHDEFFNEVKPVMQDMTKFMNRGDRNTAKNGYELCIEVEILKAEYHKKVNEKYSQRDCKSIYGLGN